MMLRQFGFAGVVALLLLASSPALADISPSAASSRIGAQPRCKKGCPCGMACISCSRTCHIAVATPPAVSNQATKARPDTAATPIQSPHTLIGANRTSGAVEHWMASSANRFFFPINCPIASLLSPSDRVAVPDTVALSAVGFRRLIMPGC